MKDLGRRRLVAVRLLATLGFRQTWKGGPSPEQENVKDYRTGVLLKLFKQEARPKNLRKWLTG